MPVAFSDRHPLRIAFVIGSLEPGGAERQVVELLKRLDRQRFQPLLYVLYRRGELETQVPADVPIAAFADPCRRQHPFWLWLGFLQLGTLAKILHLAVWLGRCRPDVVCDRTLLATLLTAPAAWCQRIPRISAAVVDPAPELRFHFRQLRPLAQWFTRWAYASAARVVCNAEHLRQRLYAEFQLPEAQVVAIPNLLNGERIPPCPAEPRQRPDPARVELIAVGRLHPQKGYPVLLEALDELVHHRRRPVYLTIVGQGRLAAELRQIVISRQLSEHVRFAGQVPNPCEWVVQADLFVLPSLFEGLPNALLEAVACGVPVIASDCPTGPREILDQGRWGTLVPPGDPRALAEAIDRFLAQPEVFREIAASARAAILQRHAPERIVPLWEHVLESVARRPSARSP
uniref:Glycosyltransferase n=1 Tax=Schlesneria paludicola TaxID=360056 RepID=A0A7C4QSA3_9PLAN